MTVKTKHHHFNPFTGERVTKKKAVNPEELQVCNDPMPEERRYGDGKYDKIFSSMKHGQALKVAPDRVGRVSAAMRAWGRKTKANIKVKSCQFYENAPDGGRVWMFKE